MDEFFSKLPEQVLVLKTGQFSGEIIILLTQVIVNIFQRYR